MVNSRAFRLIVTAFCFTSATSFAVDYFLFNSSFPHEHFDSVASQSATGFGPTTPNNVKTTASRAYQFPFALITRSVNELYVLAGLAQPVENYIAKIDPISLREIKRTSLNCPDSACPFGLIWAPSGAAHANGFIYVVAESRIWKLDNDINVIGFYELPLKEGAYNSMKVLSDGNILVKGMGLTGGSQDYSSLTIVTPDLQPVVSQYLPVEKVYGRISVLKRNGVEHIYLPGVTKAMRVRYVGGSSPVMELDPNWQYPYRTLSDTQTGPMGIMSFMGDDAYFMDNCVPTQSNAGPISFYRVNLDNVANSQRVTPWPSKLNGFHINKHIADPVTGVMVAADDTNSVMAGFRYAGNNQFVKLWEQPFKSKIIASASNGKLYTTEVTRTGEDVLIMDIVTGQVLSRIKGASPAPSAAAISVGNNRDIFYAGSGDSLVRISDRR